MDMIALEFKQHNQEVFGEHRTLKTHLKQIFSLQGITGEKK